MKPFAFAYFFFLVVLVHLIAITSGLIHVEMVTKPLIVLSLLGYYFISTRSRSGVFMMALLFCCAGDSVLMFQSNGEIFFMLGLGSFFVGHVFFILSYRKHCNITTDEKAGTQKIRLAFPAVLAGTGLVVVLFPTLGGLKIPVTLYALVITLMVIAAIFRLGRTNATSFWLVFSGALLFMISDSLIAITKFMMPLPFASLWIMVTYCGAQFLIVEGIIQFGNRSESSK